MSLTMVLESTKLLMFIHNHIVILVLTLAYASYVPF